MRLSSALSALTGDYLHVRFRASRSHAVEIVERPAEWMDAAALEKLIASCRTIVAACLDGKQLDYGLFAPDGNAWHRSVITVVRRAADNQPVAFNAMPLLPVTRGGQADTVLHLGLVMVDPTERSGGLSWVLYGLTCFALFLRGGLRPLWISSVTQVPAVVGMVAETFDNVYPGQDGTAQSFVHRHIAHQIMQHERAAFGVGSDAGFDAGRQVITNAYTGGSDNLKKSFEVAAKHRDERYNRFCAGALDYVRGDDILQIGCVDLTTARRYLMRMVPPSSLPQLLVQAAVLSVQSVAAPLIRWLDTSKPLQHLRPSQ